MDTEERSQYLDMLMDISADNGRLRADVERLHDVIDSAPDTLREENDRLKSSLAAIRENFATVFDCPDNKIKWIKVYRSVHGTGLSDSKRGVEESLLWRAICSGTPEKRRAGDDGFPPSGLFED